MFRFDREVAVRVKVRVSFVVLVIGALVALAAPAAAQAFGVEKFFAGNCKEATCGEGAEAPSESEEATKGFREAGGDVPFGVTDFKLKTVEAQSSPFKAFAPEGNVENLRVDVAPGVVTNPQAVTRCSMSDFTAKELIPNSGFFEESKCPKSSEIGVNTVTTVIVIPKGKPFEGDLADVTLTGKVYNLEQSVGLASEFGVALEVEAGVFTHTLIEGNVEWAGNYHDYFIIKNVPKGLIESRLVFEGTKSTTFGFLRNPTACTTRGPETTTTLTATPYSGEGSVSVKPYEDKVGSTECNLAFGPSFSLSPETTVADRPDGITTTLTAAHPAKPEERDDAALRTATITLPEGVTMNPSAAAGLEACTREQVGIETTRAEECPGHSQIGTAQIEVPTLPAHSLSGPIFLGKEKASEAITGPPYKIYLDAESARYGVKVRVEGVVKPNPTTGRLETKFEDTTATPNNIPQQPFNSVILHFNGGGFAPLANPVTCATSATSTSFEPFSGSTVSPVLGESPFAATGCTSTLKPEQATSSFPSKAGADSNFVFTLTRPEGQQYLEQIRAVLPPGVVGKIPTVPLCSEAQAIADNCPATSQIGTVRAAAGSGEPFAFNGTVYLTGSYKGAPYGLLFAVPVVAGPFNLGTEYVHAKIEVEPTTARVVVTTTELPQIRDGIPVRLRSMTVAIDRPNYILNPTNCGELHAESTVTSTLKTTALASSPFQVEGCSGLAFKPAFTASTSAKASKANGASLVTTIAQPVGQANIKSVLVQLPKQLPSRLTTLNKACLAKTFEQNPLGCNKEADVGTATAVTPVLPDVMKGPAVLVSHAGEEFPSLELVLEADGVRVIVEGKTHITKNITTTNFQTTPDVPVSSVTVNLPLGPFSALALERPGVTNLCTAKLVMPTTITGQNGTVVKQNTIVAPSECGVQILKRKVRGNTVYVTVETYGKGRVTITGNGLVKTKREFTAAKKTVTIKVPLSRSGRARRRPFNVKVRVGFASKQKGVKTSSASVSVRI
jgi:hypothetical protein